MSSMEGGQMRITNMEEFKERIVPLLRKEFSKWDKLSFQKWERGSISTDRCLQDFYKNNAINNDIIEEYVFEEWLKSLGYGLHFDEDDEEWE